MLSETEWCEQMHKRLMDDIKALLARNEEELISFGKELYRIRMDEWPCPPAPNVMQEWLRDLMREKIHSDAKCAQKFCTGIKKLLLKTLADAERDDANLVAADMDALCDFARGGLENVYHACLRLKTVFFLWQGDDASASGLCEKFGFADLAELAKAR